MASRMIEIEKLNRSAKTPLTWMANDHAAEAADERADGVRGELRAHQRARPSCEAASSSSRMASQARPSRPSRIRSETKTANATTSGEQQELRAAGRTGPSGLAEPVRERPMRSGRAA